jgi:hypothetical protein
MCNVSFFGAAPWKTTFDRADAFDGDFNTPKGSVKTQYMSLKMKARILADETNQVGWRPVLTLKHT